jgi:predicted DNA-binding protein (MmcQ/YjbR family)
MEIKELVKLCMEKPGTWQDTPFGPENLVMKVGKKLYAIISEETGLRINLKCEPDFAAFLCSKYKYIIPGYHMNKKHWITITITDEIDINLLKQLVSDSYLLVLNSLTKKEQADITQSVHLS